LATCLAGRTQYANQIEFLNLIVEHLTEHGAMDPSRLYESPFTDINPQGPEGVFSSDQVDALVIVLREMDARAAA
jgi:type I restriction enzyme R subunit